MFLKAFIELIFCHIYLRTRLMSLEVVSLDMFADVMVYNRDVKNVQIITRMWANAQRDGRPAE